MSGTPFLINVSYQKILFSCVNLKGNLIYFLWKRTLRLAIRLPWWHAGWSACTYNELHECGWEVEITMTDADFKNPRCNKRESSIEIFILNELREVHTHTTSHAHTHIATSVSITMATHCYSPRSLEAICKCPLFSSSSISSSDSVILLHFSPQSHHFLSQQCCSSWGSRHTVICWLIIKRVIGGVKLLRT